MLYFENDYSEGAHEEVLKRLTETNMGTASRVRDRQVYAICKGKNLRCLRMSGRRGIFSDRRNTDESDCDQFHAGLP